MSPFLMINSSGHAALPQELDSAGPGGTGGIRLLVDHDNAGILQWLPGGFAAQLGCFLIMVLVGATIATRSSAKLRRSGSS
jgi:hypothetical protein